MSAPHNEWVSPLKGRKLNERHGAHSDNYGISPYTFKTSLEILLIDLPTFETANRSIKINVPIFNWEAMATCKENYIYNV